MARSRHTLPGFRITLGCTVFYLSIIVLIPFSALLLTTFTGGWENFWHAVTEPMVVASYYVSFGISLVAALLNGVFGVIAAWVLARYQFPGRRILDAMVDLPFALPTAVAGIALCAIYAPNGMIGEWFTYQGFIGQYFSPDTALGQWADAQPYLHNFISAKGLKIAYSQIGILIALTFIGLPFVVRTVQPVIQDLSADVEEAAATLGANRWQTFCKVIFPALFPSILTGVALAYGRAVGEYGSVIFIAGNIPFKTQITPVLIVNKLEEGHGYAGAAALAFIMLLASFAILLTTNGLQAWEQRRRGTI